MFRTSIAGICGGIKAIVAKALSKRMDLSKDQRIDRVRERMRKCGLDLAIAHFDGSSLSDFEISMLELNPFEENLWTEEMRFKIAVYRLQEKELHDRCRGTIRDPEELKKEEAR